ncbi:MAG: glycosyltransferase 36 [Gracilimonas sp.]|uniref:GH36-type glycosyl hydrolase domain-containing protein n=1 Tax=Gracilimonas sp. TaxID=1974203 RepID=UPI0019B98084|nr:glucoamylase family protein [Gracilimonas sp.]MBD3616291.1 glycosyltransferase 36 [Gracilimonas sp.]
MEQDSPLILQPSLLKEDAKELSKRHVISEVNKKIRPIKPLLQHDKQTLTKAYRVLATSAKENKDISPAAEWLIDNFYIIQEQIVQIETDFPIGFQRNIPHLRLGINKGLPRVYDLVYNLALHTDNVIDVEHLTLYTQHYQQEVTLRLGELWAIPIMLRLVLVNQLALKAAAILKRRKLKIEVRKLIATIQLAETEEPGFLLRNIIDWLNEQRVDHEGQTLLVELARQLQAEGILSGELKNWFEYRLNTFGTTLNESLREERQRESKLQVSIQNAVISFRKSTEIEWEDFVEDCSLVDHILRLDPMEVYSLMDRKTKDHYRRTIERLSGRTGYTETEVAEKVLQLAEGNRSYSRETINSSMIDPSILKTHVGYYLIGKGYSSLRKELRYRRTLGEVTRKVIEGRTLIYIGLMLAMAFILLSFLWVLTAAATHTLFVKVMLLSVAFFPALELSISFINRLFAFTLPPRVLPKMRVKNEIPEQDRTLVVVPVILNNKEDVKRHLEKLEITALANPDPGLQFVLLSDFADADRKIMLKDGQVLEQAKVMISQLNERYSSQYGEKFFVLHRKREWNDSEGKWMGWERKRGKLEQLNQLLCNTKAENPFYYTFGDFLRSISQTPVRFVLTLDADTRTPPDSIKELVKVASHPLNRAILDPDTNTVREGYGIIQPRISIAPDSAYKTWFTQFFSGNVGIDPYTTAVSDVYQDLFGYGVFTGKGIYDVCAFNMVLHGRMPENRILSHDLLESTYIRTALCTDIELFDDYPANYNSYCKRNHRWVRGDWQIASWLFPKVPGASGKVKNPTSLLSRWKIFDNLRRSLNPFFLVLLLIMGWLWLPGSALLWTILAFGILAYPIYVNFSTDIFNRPPRIKWKLYFEKVRLNLKVNTIQSISTLAIFPHQAVLNIDAIFRVWWRLYVSGKKKLEWTAAAQAEHMSSNDPGSYFRSMVSSVLLGFVLLLAAFFFDPTDLWVIAPFAVLWITSPVFAWFLSQPRVEKTPELSEEAKMELRSNARRTWYYFERLVTEEFSWLPPDNDQKEPDKPPVARTSPTNIGLTLVSTASAYEMGYITAKELFERLDNTLASLEKLERYKGHFFNWYEIRLGEVLNPRYISTVDSGNLAAGLIITGQVVQKVWTQRNTKNTFWEGLTDTIITIEKIITEYEDQIQLEEDVYTQVMTCIQNMLDELNQIDFSDMSVESALKNLKTLKKCASYLSASNLMSLRNRLGDEVVDDLLYWLESPLKQIEGYKYELEFIRPHSSLEDSFSDLANKSDDPAFKQMKEQVEAIQMICNRLTNEMDFRFLYLKKRGLFSIGYNVDRAELDKATYDLLASEARIASLIAIAKGDVPSEHWFRLGRRLTSISQNEFLLSWGGTAFEYLMPLLFMRSYPHTLLSHTYRYIIEWQQSYAKRFDRPWGFSESAYNILNMDMNYQYRAFGAPGLGLKRGLAEEFVVAPYASILALMVDPVSSFQNLKELNDLGALGLWGYYDAIDYTREHLNEKEPYKVVMIYMAHHHGMSLIALTNVLNDWVIQDYFHADPRIKACELLLQERIPVGIPIKEPHPIDVELEPGEKYSPKHIIEQATEADLANIPPRVHLISNGKLHSFVSHAGTGCLKYEDITLTGWKADAVEDPLGTFIYVKDLETDKYWSAFHQPVQRKADRYDSWFHNEKIQTSRVDEWIETTTEVCISPDHPVQLHKLTLTNYSDRHRKLELTSYGEIILNQWESHSAHPAFSKLFVQTDFLAEHDSIISWRRPRSADEQPIYLVHTLVSQEHEYSTKPIQFETERSKFIGRGRSLRNPSAMDVNSKLSGSTGNVSDPIFSIRKYVEIAPGEKMEVTFVTGWAASFDEARQITERFDDPYSIHRVFDLSVIYNNVELEQLGISSGQFHLFQKLASYVLYNDSKLRANESLLVKNRRLQSNLWGYGISGDIPLVVFRISDINQINYVKRMLKGHLLWKYRGLNTDLLILNDHPPSYADEVEEGIKMAMEHYQSLQKVPGGGNVFVHRSEMLPEEDLNLMLTVASIVLEGAFPNLDEMAAQERTSSVTDSEVTFIRIPKVEIPKDEVTHNLKYFNGFGGFTSDENSYQLIIKRDPETGDLNLPPVPWVNVIANPEFGFLVTESGGGYTWSENSRENKLTSWANDVVLDPLSEAFYIREHQNQHYWSLTPAPAPGSHPYIVTHGFGYTTYEHTSMDIHSVLTQYVDPDNPVKISKIRIRNTGSTRKELSLFSYNEWVLGVQRERSSRFVVQEFDEDLNTLFAENRYNNEFAERTAFAAILTEEHSGAGSSFTTNRLSFIGRNNSLENPDGVCGSELLDNEVITGGEPCAAFQNTFALDPGEEMEFIVLLGQAESRSAAEELIRMYQEPRFSNETLVLVREFWGEMLSTIKIETPDDALNTIMNGWLMYQTIACRMWARTGYYQAGGAFGFRDQLQDSLAVMYVDSEMARKQILIHASRQFPEGDVLHWWHPPTTRGIRSRISDDRLWLAYAVLEYIQFTGRIDILDETVPFIQARKLQEYEHEVYLQPHQSSEQGTIYDHCLRAIDISLQFGSHGLPLIGGGDWNDGMNRVGLEGKGESVWLGFFIHHILTQFAKLARDRDDKEIAEAFMDQASALFKKLNTEGWDGSWYLRAFYDDGTPLGSAENTECQIDAISQAWSIISGVSPAEKEKTVIESLETHLISAEDGIIRLLYPPFDKTEKDPGYIKGYVPGVRENGGQYTHAALWVIKALAESGHGEKAVRYLQMINPVNHGRDPQKMRVYKTEPYVVAADVYGEPPFVGQGGWTWYTGSAGWMYKVVIESILGLQLSGEEMIIDPAISSDWEAYKVKWVMSDHKTIYHIEIENTARLEKGNVEINIDGKQLNTKTVPARIELNFDGGEHKIRVRLIVKKTEHSEEKTSTKDM